VILMDVPYQLFRNVFAIIVAALILVMLFDFGFKYMSFGEFRVKNKVLNDFRVASVNSILTGNSEVFTDFGKAKFSECIYSFEPIEGLHIFCDNIGSRVLDINTIFQVSNEIYLEPHIQDLKFWKYYFLTGFPKRQFVFFFKRGFGMNPFPTSSEVENQLFPLVQSLSSFGEYALCKDSNLKCYYKEACSQEEFKNYLESIKDDYPTLTSIDCSIDKKENRIIVEFTDGTCSQKADVCFRKLPLTFPDNYWLFEAHIYLNGTDNVFFVNNLPEMVALILANDQLYPNGQPMATSFYESVSKKYLFDLKNILFMLDERAHIMKSMSHNTCPALWDRYISNIDALLDVVEKGVYEDENSLTYSKDYLAALEATTTSFEELVNSGCDYKPER